MSDFIPFAPGFADSTRVLCSEELALGVCFSAQFFPKEEAVVEKTWPSFEDFTFLLDAHLAS